MFFVNFCFIQNTVLLPFYLNKHLIIIINSHESLLGNGHCNWNIARCTFHIMIETVTISWGSRCQLLVSSPSFSSDSRNIGWLTISKSAPFCDSPISSFSNFWANSLKENRHRLITIYCHGKSLLDYHQTPPLHPQLQHFCWEFHLRIFSSKELFPTFGRIWWNFWIHAVLLLSSPPPWS